MTTYAALGCAAKSAAKSSLSHPAVRSRAPTTATATTRTTIARAARRRRQWPPSRERTIGKIKGHAVFDLDAGWFAETRLRIVSETEFDEARVALSNEVELTRTAGNPLNITPRAR